MKNVLKLCLNKFPYCRFVVAERPMTAITRLQYRFYDWIKLMCVNSTMGKSYRKQYKEMNF